METLGQGLRALRNGLLKNMPEPIIGALRHGALGALYASRFGGGRRVMVAGKHSMFVEWERLSVDFGSWEASFTSAFIDALSSQDVVFDVGASIGEWSALAATIVGADRVHVFEPDRGSWRHIEKVFRLNSLPVPAGIIRAFVSDQDRDSRELRQQISASVWPQKTKARSEFKDLARDHEIASITLDTYRILANARPTVVKIDVEGAEGVVLRGAALLLREDRPRLFLSLHPTEVGKFGDTPAALLNHIESLGYQNTLLGSDHEEHWLCTPIEPRP